MQREAQARIHTLVASVADKSKLGGSAIVGQLGSLIKTEKPKVCARNRRLCAHCRASPSMRAGSKLRGLVVACGRMRMRGLQLPGQLDKGDETGDDEGDDDGDQPDDGMPGRQVQWGRPRGGIHRVAGVVRGHPCGIRPVMNVPRVP